MAEVLREHLQKRPLKLAKHYVHHAFKNQKMLMDVHGFRTERAAVNIVPAIEVTHESEED